MFKPTDDQIEFELDRLNNITYEIVFKYFKVIQDRIENIRKLITKNDLFNLHDKFNFVIDKFNDLCNQANGTPQSY